MPFDYKKEYKEFYLPPQKPQLLEVPPMNYVAVRGHGDPNAQDGEYQAAIVCGCLYHKNELQRYPPDPRLF